MDKEKFNQDFEFYKSKLSKSFDDKTVQCMMIAYCMGYMDLTGQLNEEFDSMIDVNPVLDKIKSLTPI